MAQTNNIDGIQTIRPRVLEIDGGLFRGYVDIQSRQADGATSRKSQYCQNISSSRSLAERHALELANHLRAASQHEGVTTQLLDDSLSNHHNDPRELDNIPAFLVRRPHTRTIVHKHLRAVA